MAIRALPPSPSPSPSSPSPSPQAAMPPSTVSTTTAPIINQSSSSPSLPLQNSKIPVDFSPPLIAMVVVVAAAFLVITYSRLISRYLLRLLRRYQRWRGRRRRRYLPSTNLDSPPPPFDSPEGFHVYSPYGLDESVIKTLPLFTYTATAATTKNSKDKGCAVCLLEFEDDDYVRMLPVCSHSFHVDCIDIWLRSHANCPLCRARIFWSDASPFTPVMAARIRPSLDDTVLRSFTLETIIQNSPPATTSTATEITSCIEIEEISPRRNNNNFLNYSQSEDRYKDRGFLLKRSYSFGFERSLAASSERMLAMEPATASPWRYRRGGGGGFWSKRPSPFGSSSKPRVFSFRYYRGMKSPFVRRRGGFFPLSERVSTAGSGGGGSSRRSKSMASPMFLRSSVAVFSSSRLRCGDPEALLSPERLNRR